MITSLSFQSGFAKELVPKKLNFKTGINILFGPNACGKTTTLKTLAAHSACHEGGWTNVPLPEFQLRVSCIKDWFKVFRKHTPDNCKSKVSWDGTPCFLFMPDHNPSAFASLYETDGIVDSKDHFIEFVENFSAGQRIILRLHRLKEALRSMPDFSKTPDVIPTIEGDRQYKGVNSLYQENADKFIEFMNSFKKKTNTPTILMDEPDKSLAIPDACLLWNQAIPRLAEKFQLIIATHCPFAFLNKNAHWIPMGKDQDYIKKCQESISKFMTV